jgi:hypothetical protein
MLRNGESKVSGKQSWLDSMLDIGTTDHQKLDNRDVHAAHPAVAIQYHESNVQHALDMLGGKTVDHGELSGRDAGGSHPASAIHYSYTISMPSDPPMNVGVMTNVKDTLDGLRSSLADIQKIISQLSDRLYIIEDWCMAAVTIADAMLVNHNVMFSVNATNYIDLSVYVSENSVDWVLRKSTTDLPPDVNFTTVWVGAINHAWIKVVARGLSGKVESNILEVW